MIERLIISVGMMIAIPASVSAMNDQLDSVEAPVIALAEQYPGISDIRGVLIADCEEQHEQLSDDEQAELCRCGSALTLRIWLQSEQMLELLNSYLASPDATALSDFVNYQGPELYAPYCNEVLEG